MARTSARPRTTRLLVSLRVGPDVHTPPVCQSADMRSTGVDPRDQTWEVPHPKYRVYFHDASGASDEYEVEGADVPEVLAWAEAKRGDRTFLLYACVARNGPGLLRLHGHDPNEH
jgi:hypothetical protein